MRTVQVVENPEETFLSLRVPCNWELIISEELAENLLQSGVILASEDRGSDGFTEHARLAAEPAPADDAEHPHASLERLGVGG